MNSSLSNFLRTLPPGATVDIQLDSVPGTGGPRGTELVLGLRYQGIIDGFSQFTHWPGVKPEEMVRISLGQIDAVIVS